MSFNISYHPISEAEMIEWYFDRLFDVAAGEDEPLRAIAENYQMAPFYREKYIETVGQSTQALEELPFERTHWFLLAIVQGYFRNYFYTHNSAFSFLVQQYPYLKKYIVSPAKLKPQHVKNKLVAETIHEHYQGGVYIPADRVIQLLHDYKENNHLRAMFQEFFNDQLPIFLKALKAAATSNMGLLEASDVIIPNAFDLNASECYSNLFNCDMESLQMFQRCMFKGVAAV